MLLVAGAAFTATQDDRLWVAGVLILTALLVAPFRACFYRHASLLSGPLEASSAHARWSRWRSACWHWR